jgi:hypothetical protein
MPLIPNLTVTGELTVEPSPGEMKNTVAPGGAGVRGMAPVAAGGLSGDDCCGGDSLPPQAYSESARTQAGSAARLRRKKANIFNIVGW